MFENWEKDVDITRYMTLNPHQSIKMMKSILAS